LAELERGVLLSWDKEKKTRGEGGESVGCFFLGMGERRKGTSGLELSAGRTGKKNSGGRVEHKGVIEV